MKTLACLIILFFVSCNTKVISIPSVSGQAFPEPTPIHLTPDELKKAVYQITELFHDTLSAQARDSIWAITTVQYPADSTGYWHMLKYLKSRGFAVYTISPCIYESFCVLASLPQVSIFVTEALTVKTPVVSTSNEASHATQRLHEIAANAQMHILSAFEKTESGYMISTRDGLRWHGLSGEPVIGNVFTTASKESPYLRIASHLIITRLTIQEVDHHITEWHTFLTDPAVAYKVSALPGTD